MAKLPAFALLSPLLFIVSSYFSITLASSTFNRSCFPPKFIFGASSAAYQYEGAVAEGGRTPSIWDTYTHEFPERIADGSNGDVANDFYHRYKGDVKLMKYLGLDTFRMSISWSRILPNGKLSGGINKEGVAFYNNVFNELLANGIIPFVTLFHWDLPQALEDEYGGFLSPQIITDYTNYVDVCFKEFGDRVKHWITLNEPFVFTSGGYDGNFVGNLAPGRCSNRTLCAAGNSSTEPYIVTHNLLLSHGAAVKLYKSKYLGLQKGIIGITLVSHWFVPFSNSVQDAQAAQRILDFMLGWYFDPIVYGEYPSTMRSIVGDRLPKFSKEERELLKGSFDFVGLNYYTGIYAAHVLSRPENDTSSTADSMTSLVSFRNGVPIGDPTGVPIFFVYPQGLHDLLVYIKEKYKDPIIYITENGIGDFSNGTATAQQLIRDPQRIDFYRRHLRAVLSAIREGVKVKGFMAWTFMDDFEWGAGYTNLFGLLYVDRDNGLKRIFKLSALWYRKFLAIK